MTIFMWLDYVKSGFFKGNIPYMKKIKGFVCFSLKQALLSASKDFK